MCYNPITIVNNVKTGHRNITLTRTVPCGCCLECQAKYQNEWFIRAYYQFKETVVDGKGCCSFITQTYNDRFLPEYTDTFYLPTDETIEYNGETVHVYKKQDFKIKCFNRDHIRYFMRLVRRYCKTYLNYTKEDVEQIKYIVCSEYGTALAHTHRSHYHSLLFFPYPLTETELRKILDFAWAVCDPRDKGKRFEEQRRYKLGFTSFGKHGAFVKDPRALKYCMKYTSKNMNGFMDWHGIIQYIKSSPENYKKIRDYLPFHAQSKGFGLYGAQFISDEDLKKGFINSPHTDNFENADTLPIPEYYKRKIYFEKPKINNNASVGMYQHTQRYYDNLKDTIANKLNKEVQNLRDILYSLETFSAHYANCVKSFLQFGMSKVETYNLIMSILGKDRIKEYALYNALLRYSTANGVYNESKLFDTLVDFEKLTAEIHDNIVNTVDLTEPKYELKHVLDYETEFQNYYVPVEKLYNYQGKTYEDFLQDYTDMVSVLDIPFSHVEKFCVLVDKPKIQKQRIIKYKQNGEAYRQANKDKYLSCNPTIRDNIAYDKQWHDYAIFNDLNVIHDIFDVLNKEKKSVTSNGNFRNFLHRKYVRDTQDFLTYQTI